jgi:hypothetical protein
MRLTLVGMGSIGLTATSASAEEEEKTSRFHYETCNCHFGYGDTCQVVAACVRRAAILKILQRSASQ